MNDKYKIPIKDQAFYSTLAKYIAIEGKESILSLIPEVNFTEKVIPYHYYEIWLASIFIKWIGINSFVAHSGITYGISIFVTLLLLTGTVQIHKSINYKNFIVLLFSITFLFQRPLFFYFYPNDASFYSIFTEGSFKFIHLVPFYLFIPIFIRKNLYSISIVFLLLLVTINTVTLPWVFLLIILILVSTIISNWKSINMKNYKLEVFLIVIFTLFFLYYLNINESTSSSSIVTSISGIVNNITENAVRWIVMNIFLLVSWVLIVIKTKKREEYFIMYFVIMNLLSALFARAIFDTTQNSYQIFQSASYLIIYTIVLQFSRLIFSNDKLKYLILIIPITSLYFFIKDVKAINYLFNNNVSKYSDLGYLDSISKLKLRNSKGLKLFNGDGQINTVKNPVFAGMNEYFVFNKKLFSTVVINTKQLLPEKNDSSFISQCIRNEFIPLCYFNKLINYDVYSNDSIEYSQSIEKFIKIYEPSFLIVDSGIQIPVVFDNLILMVLTDRYNGERFIVLKDY